MVSPLFSGTRDTPAAEPTAANRDAECLLWGVTAKRSLDQHTLLNGQDNFTDMGAAVHQCVCFSSICKRETLKNQRLDLTRFN